MDISIEHSKFVFFDEKQRSEIEFFFNILPSKLLFVSDELMSHMALNDTYIGIIPPGAEDLPNILDQKGIKFVGIDWFYDVGYAHNKLWQFWLAKTNCTTFHEMRLQGDQEWKNFDWTGLESGDGMNYQIIDLEDWVVVKLCKTIRGKVIKFAQSLKYVGKQALSQTASANRLAKHNDVMALRLGDYGIDRYIISRHLRGLRTVGIQTSYHQATHVYAFIEALQIMQLQKTPMIAAKNIKPGDSIASYVRNPRTSKFHGIFIDMLAEALETVIEDGIYITTDAEIAKTKATALNMQYADMDTFLRFSCDLVTLLREHNRTMDLIKLDGFTHEEFKVFCGYMVAQTIIEVNGETIRLLR